MSICGLFFMKKTFETSENLLVELKNWISEGLKDQVESEILELVIIAVNEAIQNIYRYAYLKTAGKKIIISLEVNDENLIFKINDFGISCKDKTFLVKKRTPNEAGGMGINIINKIASYFDVSPTSNGNITVISFDQKKLKTIDL